MINNKVSRIVIVTKNNKPVGIITGHDLLPINASFGTGAKKKRTHVYTIWNKRNVFGQRCDDI
jgi:CBS domain-containing protein